jgi:hypothetical protein
MLRLININRTNDTCPVLKAVTNLLERPKIIIECHGRRKASIHLCQKLGERQAPRPPLYLRNKCLKLPPSGLRRFVFQHFDEEKRLLQRFMNAADSS